MPAEREPAEDRRAGRDGGEPFDETDEPAAFGVGAGDADGEEPDDRGFHADSLQLLLDGIGRYPLLTAAEEVQLAQRIERGDRAAFERMVTCNLRLVVSIAKRFQGHGLPLVDLIQEGVIGLHRAVEKYDWRRGCKFSTYATWWISQGVRRGLAVQGRTIRLPVHVLELQRRSREAERVLSGSLGRPPTRTEVARWLGVDERRLRLVDAAAAAASVPWDDADERSVPRTAAEEEPAAPGGLVERELTASAVRSAVGRLPDDERAVVVLRFGLGQVEARSLDDTGRVLGLNRRRVKRLETAALERLSEMTSLAALGETA